MRWRGGGATRVFPVLSHPMPAAGEGRPRRAAGYPRLHGSWADRWLSCPRSSPAWVQVVEAGLGYLPFSEKIVLTPTGHQCVHCGLALQQRYSDAGAHGCSAAAGMAAHEIDTQACWLQVLSRLFSCLPLPAACPLPSSCSFPQQVRGRRLCQEAVRREHHPQRGEHGERAARLLQGHQDRQDPGAQVRACSSSSCSLPWRWDQLLLPRRLRCWLLR